MKKGFFSIILVLAVLELSLSVLDAKNAVAKETQAISKQTLEIEKAFFRRAEIENNVDFLVKKTLEKELLAKNLDPQKIRQKVAERITNFSKSFGKDKEKTSFFIEENHNKNAIAQERLEDATQVLVVSQKGITFAVFYFTGGINNDKKFKAEISEGNYFSQFEMPAGYMAKAVVVGT